MFVKFSRLVSAGSSPENFATDFHAYPSVTKDDAGRTVGVVRETRRLPVTPEIIASFELALQKRKAVYVCEYALVKTPSFVSLSAGYCFNIAIRRVPVQQASLLRWPLGLRDRLLEIRGIYPPFHPTSFITYRPTAKVDVYNS